MLSLSIPSTTRKSTVWVSCNLLYCSILWIFPMAFLTLIQLGILMLAGSDLLTAVTGNPLLLLQSPGLSNLLNFGHVEWFLFLVLNHALTGLVMAAIVKYLDNIARVYAHSMSMIITIFVSSIWLQRVPSIQFVFGSIIVLISLHLYHLPYADYSYHHPHADRDEVHCGQCLAFVQNLTCFWVQILKKTEELLF